MVLRNFIANAGKHTTGVGIGLAVCRRVAESLGGTVEVALGNDAGGNGGTEFRLRLPLAAYDVEPSTVMEAALASAGPV